MNRGAGYGLENPYRTVFNSSAVGEKVSGRNRQGTHPSGVAFKRGFTVAHYVPSSSRSP